jgi:hypothetical protein
MDGWRAGDGISNSGTQQSMLYILLEYQSQKPQRISSKNISMFPFENESVHKDRIASLR